MRLLVCGGRDYADRKRVADTLNDLHETCPIELLIHGAASGADTLAKKWADENGVEDEPFPAAWTDLETSPVVKRYRRDGTPYNAAAGGIRNQQMIDEGKPDLVVAFPGGRGTADMMSRARKANINVIEIER